MCTIVIRPEEIKAFMAHATSCALMSGSVAVAIFACRNLTKSTLDDYREVEFGLALILAGIGIAVRQNTVMEAFAMCTLALVAGKAFIDLGRAIRRK